MTEYSAKDLERKRKEAARREWIDQKRNDITMFVDRHKDMIVPVAIATVGMIGKVGKEALKIYADGKQQELRERRIYDPSSGCYVETRDKLTQDEKIELDERRRNGETVTQALNNMGVLR